LGRRSPGQQADSQAGHRRNQCGLPDSIAHTIAISFTHGAVGPSAVEICNPYTNRRFRIFARIGATLCEVRESPAPLQVRGFFRFNPLRG
jgi:hypothetical protein